MSFKRIKLIHMKKYLLIFGIIPIIFEITCTAQCNVKTTHRPDGVTVRYLNPDLVGKGTGCELGLSVSTDGSDFYINTTIRYFVSPKKQINNLKIQFYNDESAVLNLYTSELATMQGENVSLGVYLTTPNDLIRLKSLKIKRIIFTESNGVNQIITLSQNNDLIIKHLKCLE